VSAPATRYEVSGGVATVTLDRAESRNALSAELVDALGDDLARAVADDAVRVVVLTNEGPAFSAGADLKGSGAAGRWDLPGVLRAILDAPKPVVGRIAGHCMGGGVGLAAACDISIAADDARFGFTEVRIGVAPAIISVVCLPKMRRGDALELFLRGERITATRAAEVGLITRTSTRADLDLAVAAVVGDLAAGGPAALAAAKQLVMQVPAMQRDDAFAWTAELSAALFASAEAAAGVAAFREKTLPPWAPPTSP
jgi:methylglutaconyl-CoA hydratase